MLHTHEVFLNLDGEVFQTDVVVSALNTEPIFSLDFPQRYGASVDLGKKQLVFGSDGRRFRLTGPGSNDLPVGLVSLE